MTDELKKSTDFTCPECCQPECAPGCAGLAIKDSVLPVRDAHAELRARFEAWHQQTQHYLRLFRDETGDYVGAWTQGAWEVWQAAVAQAAPASPASPVLPDNLALSDNPLPANLAPPSPASAPVAQHKVPMKEIGDLLAEAMNQAVKSGADSRSMADEYVAIAHWLAYSNEYAAHIPPLVARKDGAP